MKHSQVSQRCQIEEVSYALVFNSNLPFAKAIPNVQLFQIPNGRALIPTMRCNGQDNVTNIIMDLKKKKPFSIILQQQFRRLRKLTIECILVCASFQVPMPLKTIQSIYHKLFHSNIIIYPYLLFWWWWWTSTILVEFNLLYMSNLVQSTIQSVWSDFRFGSHSGKALKFSHSRICSCCKVFAAIGAKAPT